MSEPRPRFSEATQHPRGVEWGVYVERYDGGVWTPVIYGDMTRAEATSIFVTFSTSHFRLARVVRRFVQPWKEA